MSLLLSLLVLCAQGEPGGLRWPLGPGDQFVPLRATHGQLQGSGTSWDFHLGLDLLGTDGDPVTAVEAGTVVKVRVKDDGYAAVVVASRDVPGRAFLYLHLQGKPLVARKQKIEAGDPLGFVSGKAPKEPHLHLARLGGAYASSKLPGISKFSTRDPLALLATKTAADDLEPVIEPIDASSDAEPSYVGIRTDDGSSVEGELAEYEGEVVESGAVAGEWVDLIVKAYDPTPGTIHRVAPQWLRLTIDPDGTPLEFAPLDFDRALPKDDNWGIYSLSSPYESSGDTGLGLYDYWFILTNAGFDPARPKAWFATPGTHTVRIEIRDAAGRTKELKTKLTYP